MKLPSTPRALTIGIGAILGLALIAGLLGLGRQQVDWTPTFTETQTEPYAAALLRNRLADLFPGQEIHTVTEPAFEHLVYRAERGSSYLFFNDDLLMDDESTDALLDYVAAGNHALLATEDFSPYLLDRLGVTSATQRLSDSLDFRLLGAADSGRAYHLPPSAGGVYFSDWDERYTTVEGRYGQRSTNVLRIYEGEGTVILCATPRIFSNYYLLHPRHHAYLAGILSLLPATGPVYWDEYYKRENLARIRRRARDREDSPGLLAYFMAQEALRWGLILALASLLLYATFEAKRRQRIIPLISPLPNTTLDFTRTVGRLYFQRSDHRNLGTKRIRALLEHIRAHYFLRTETLSEEFIRALAGKSGLPEGEIRLLCRYIDRFRQQRLITENQLVELNHHIESFYRNAAR